MAACASDSWPTACCADRSCSSASDSMSLGTDCDVKAPCKANDASKDKARSTEGDSSNGYSAVPTVLCWLLLLLTIVGFLWCCVSSFSLQHTMPQTPERIESSRLDSLRNEMPEMPQVILGHSAEVLAAPEATEDSREQGWEDIGLPTIALLILAGYGGAIFAMIYLPSLIGAEATIYVFFAALISLPFWRWWSSLLLHLVLNPSQCLPLLFLAVLAAVGSVLYPIVNIVFCGGGLVEDQAAYTQASKQGKVKSLESVLQEAPLDEAAPEMRKEDGSTQTSEEGVQVQLHIYDITHEWRIERLNSLMAPRLCPLKLGGLFHAGVEVNGKEWSFGYSPLGSGVASIEPCSHPSHHFRETISLPCTQLSEKEIVSILNVMCKEYQGRGYNLIRRNCIHFADDFCQRLGVGGVPLWVQRLVLAGEWSCDCFIELSQLLEQRGAALKKMFKYSRFVLGRLF